MGEKVNGGCCGRGGVKKTRTKKVLGEFSYVYLKKTEMHEIDVGHNRTSTFQKAW